MAKPTFYEGPERRRQVLQFAKTCKAQGADSNKLFEDTCSFNEEHNDPPLPNSDIKHLISTLEAMQKTGQTSTRATSMIAADGSKISRYADRTVTLPCGRKVKMRGAEIIGLDE